MCTLPVPGQDFPSWVRGAGWDKVDVFLQPSWTWGPIGPLHAYDNAYRAVENGFQLLRCSSGGLSGAISPTYTWQVGAAVGGGRELSPLSCDVGIRP
jgi:hypothetical protein